MEISPIRIVFMGSGKIACRSMDALIRNPLFQIKAVITQPPRPKGRGLTPEPSPAGEFAASKNLYVLTPENVNDEESFELISGMNPDVIVVVAYGQFLARKILDIPPAGCVNLHASLLPKYRGAAPIQWAIANGETRTGVTTMLMNEKMDDGDILLQESVDIGPDETSDQLHDRLAEIGASLLVKTLIGMKAGEVKPVPQDRTQATIAPKLRKEYGKIIWTMPAAGIYNRFRAFYPWPGSYCEIEGEKRKYRLNIIKCRVESANGDPGTIIDISQDGPLVAAGSGSLRLTAVQPEGRQPMDGGSFLRGYKLEKGAKLI